MKEGVEVECYIPGLEEKLKKFISSSILCIISDKKTSNKKEEVMPFPKDDRPFSTHWSRRAHDGGK
jgi:hypothetical protein